MNRLIIFTTALGILLTTITCEAPSSIDPLAGLLKDVPAIARTVQKTTAESPYVTAGDRLYMVGDQNGTFPPHGWHVAGEMGGIWAHPIKLLDGFEASLQLSGKEKMCLGQATSFVNYPFANEVLYTIPEAALTIRRLQFVPDGKEALVVHWIIENHSDQSQSGTLDMHVMTDLRPVWLGERTQMIDGRDQLQWDEAKGAWLAKDSLNPWYVAWAGSETALGHEPASELCSLHEHKGFGQAATTHFSLDLPANGQQVLTLTIAGSSISEEAVWETLGEVKEHTVSLLAQKKTRYQQLDQLADIQVPDTALQQVLTWTKYNTDWLIRDVPAVGRALSAGMADYPWWFGCDNTYSLQGVLASGRPELARTTLDLLKSISEQTNGNGRVVHEVSTNGAVYNPGNLNETPHFVAMVWTYFEWTGDTAFLREYYPFVQQGMAWLLENHDSDQDLLVEGAGMMEIPGLESEMIDVAVYTQQAFADLARMAAILAEPEAVVNAYKGLAASLQAKINQAFWVPDFQSYADFISTKEEALHLIDAAIVRADTLQKPWAVAELRATRQQVETYPEGEERGFVVFHNWVVNTPLEMGIADADKALKALKTGKQFVNPYGVFVTGIDRDESAGEDAVVAASRKKTFSYVGAVMTLPTGIQAIAENNYGRPDQALDYLQRLGNSFSYLLPGSMFEVSPDFGMMTQAWTIYAVYYPVVQQFFGIKPMAYQHTVRIQPQMPSAWQEASLKRLPVGQNELSMTIKRVGGQERIHLTQTVATDTLVITYPEGSFESWTVNGEPFEPERKNGKVFLKLWGDEVMVSGKAAK